jgi:hypothetical protein
MLFAQPKEEHGYGKEKEMDVLCFVGSCFTGFVR